MICEDIFNMVNITYTNTNFISTKGGSKKWNLTKGLTFFPVSSSSFSSIHCFPGLRVAYKCNDKWAKSKLNTDPNNLSSPQLRTNQQDSQKTPKQPGNISKLSLNKRTHISQ